MVGGSAERLSNTPLYQVSPYSDITDVYSDIANVYSDIRFFSYDISAVYSDITAYGSRLIDCENNLPRSPSITTDAPNDSILTQLLYLPLNAFFTQIQF